MINKINSSLPHVLQNTRTFSSSQKQQIILVVALSALTFLSLIYLMKRSYDFLISKITDSKQMQQLSPPLVDVLNEEVEVESDHSNMDHNLLRDTIKALSDPSMLEEDDVIDTSDCFLEKQAIETCLEKPESRKLIEHINSVISSGERDETMLLLYVLAGIKPGAVITPEKQDRDLLISILQQLCLRFSNLRFEVKNHQILFVNEVPLKAFDPKRYLLPLKDKKTSLMDALINNWNAAETSNTTQMLSYLLGFGPSWEAYANNLRLRDSDFADLCLFSDEHYRERGKVLLDHNIDFGEKDSIKIGRAYHVQFPKLLSKGQNLSIRVRKYKKPYVLDCIGKIQEYTLFYFMYDGISARTSYSKKQFHLLKWMESKYSPKLG